MAAPAGWGALGFTSGRRTYRGNRLVGGVTNSGHLTGTAADFTAPLSVLQARFPGHHILDEGDHRHVSGLSDVPYYGRQGIAGLVNGVDTTAHQGAGMLQPRKARPNLAAMSQVVGGIDPLGPMSAIPQPAMAQAPQMPPQEAPPVPMQPHRPKLNGAAIAGILGDALAAYGGQRGVFAPMMADQRHEEAEDNRFQQRLAAEIEERRRRAMEPPQEFQTADYFNQLPPEARQRFLSARDAISPIVADIAQPDGSVRRSIIPRGQMSGPQPGVVEDGYVFVGGDPADPNNWRPQ